MSINRLILGFVLCFIALACIQSGIGSAQADTGGRFRIPELPAGTVITLDGADGDWPAGALTFTFTPITGPAASGKMFIKHPDDPMLDEELYIFISVSDATSNVGPAPNPIDDVILMLDNSHDQVAPDTSSFNASDDRGISFGRDGTVKRIFGVLTAPTDDSDPTPFPTARKFILPGATPTSWTMEARLLPSDLGLNSFHALVGAAIIARDWNSGSAALSRWPSLAAVMPTLTWANLITRMPIDYVLLIDQSGSMFGSKWESAKRAGNNFAAILSKMKDSTLDSEFSALGQQGDRLGLANFTWSGGDQSSILKALTGIPVTPGDYTSVLPPNPGGATPIAGGINKAVEMFGGVAALSSTPRTRIVMLMTDGQHNSPSTTITFTPKASGGDFDYVPQPCAANSLVRVNPVAIGSDTTVDPAKLNDIKNCFSGKAFTKPDSSLNIYNIADPNEVGLTAQLTKYFVEALTPYYGWNVLSDTLGPAPNFSLKAGERKLILFAFWDNKNNAVPLSIKKPDLSVVTGTADTNLGYSILTIDNPPAGNYTDFTAAGATGSKVLLDLRVEGRFAIDNEPHGTGSTITLRAKLREDGKPLKGADVRVDISKPGEGFGTYVSTHTLANCEAAPPQLPPLDQSGKNSSVGLTSKLSTQTPSAASTTGQGDVSAPRFLLMEQLLKKCNKNALIRTQDPGLKLYDDGTHGDLVADDGLYTLSFENTQYEGSYVFRFRANGTTPAGVPFARVREIGEYVRVDVDPAQTTLDSRVLSQAGTVVTRQYYVTPRDRFAGYLGPGYPEQVQFLTSGGQWLGAVTDYNNGIYAQTLRYDTRQGEPQVTPTVQGKVVGKPSTLLPWWLCLLIILILVAIIVVLLLMRLLR